MALIINGCAPAYVPNVVNTPLLSNKGEFQAAIYTGSSGIDPQFAYAITGNTGIMLNGSFTNTASSSASYYDKHQFVESGIGYYCKIGEIGRFETFGGYGMGKVRAEFDNFQGSAYSDANFNRIFIHPTIGITTKIFDGSFTPRVVMVNMYQAANNSSVIFLEPVITFKIGYKYVKAVIQFGISMPYNSSDIGFNHQPFLFSLGLQGFFNKKH